MTNFITFKKALQDQFERMAKHELFITKESKDAFWDLYLDSFREGDNEIFRERREYDCQCCKQFIRNIGQVVAIIDGKRETIWDIDVGAPYQIVADTLSAALQDVPIATIYRHYEPAAGTNHNHQLLEDGTSHTWEHFYVKLPSRVILRKSAIASLQGKVTSQKSVQKRGLEEITLDAAEIILELIDQNSLYRGEEHRNIVQAFILQKREFDTLEPQQGDEFCWLNHRFPIRNTVIGTLLVDLSNGTDLNIAVNAFESKVAPINYKRPNALITESMIRKAKEKIEALGIVNSLQRRYAHIDDITVNNILFANRDAKKDMDIFDNLTMAASSSNKQFNKVEEVSIDTFIKDILPQAHKVEVLFENKHQSNLMSLIAPTIADAPNILRWKNNFSWSYNGDVTDSIKDRVAKAGGDVHGVLRCSLGWFNSDDLDIHVIEPNGNHIFHNSLQSRTGGNLDVDMNVKTTGAKASRKAVENITWPIKSNLLEKEYLVYVNNYYHRENIDVGFDLEIEFDGIIHSFHYPQEVRQGQDIKVARFTYSHQDGITFGKSLTSNQSTKEYWNINSQSFQEVSVIMQSPNHWDSNKTGNKHWFFMLKECINPNDIRGLYNEFLSDDLHEHRKVFEVLGAKLMVPTTIEQLSGLGFSSTKRNQITCRVSGNFNRVIKVNF